MPKRSPVSVTQAAWAEKHHRTTEAARQLLEQERLAREAKTARLRELRQMQSQVPGSNSAARPELTAH